MADVDTLKAAAKATVVEAAASLSSMALWALHHYEGGKPVGGSLARGDQVHEWLRDLEQAGYVVGFGWELRGEETPADWPGWPIDEEKGSDPAAYPAPGSEIPGQSGYVVGTCGHRVAGSEWRAGLRTCERCPNDDDDEDLSGEARCRICGCTENNPCEGGCSWVSDPQMGDLCSACAPTTTLLAEVVDQFNAGDITPYDAMSRVQELLGGGPADGEVSEP